MMLFSEGRFPSPQDRQVKTGFHMLGKDNGQMYWGDFLHPRIPDRKSSLPITDVYLKHANA